MSKWNFVPVLGSVGRLADSYRDVGGFDRSWAGVSVGSAAFVPTDIVVPAKPVRDVRWTDDAALEADYVERRRREVEAQLRNPKNVSELKALYGNRCFFCQQRTIVGVDPERFYSEAAHIKPLGNPHNGPDQKSNMVLLCPEHHLQFDRGVLRLRRNAAGLVVDSRIVGDPLDRKSVAPKEPHVLDQDQIDWHFSFWDPA